VAERLEGPCRILDVGTGSGAILLALLARLPEARGVGVDLSGEALAFARRNASRLGLEERTDLVRGDLCAAVRPGPMFDAVVSNPPYVRTGEAVDLAPEIRDHEPPTALLAGTDGLDVIRRLIPEAAARLRPRGWLALELGITQAETTLALLPPEEWHAARIVPDLTGRPRILMARRGAGRARARFADQRIRISRMKLLPSDPTAQ
jgi:release factor glutamine methyltransferase